MECCCVEQATTPWWRSTDHAWGCSAGVTGQSGRRQDPVQAAAAPGQPPRIRFFFKKTYAFYSPPQPRVVAPAIASRRPIDFASAWHRDASTGATSSCRHGRWRKGRFAAGAFLGRRPMPPFAGPWCPLSGRVRVVGSSHRRAGGRLRLG